MSINFLLQSIKILYSQNYNDNELRMIYDFLKSLDNDELNTYNNTCTVLTYNSDLELYIEIIDSMLKIFEENEEYEKCVILKNKKQSSLDIMCYEKN